MYEGDILYLQLLVKLINFERLPEIITIFKMSVLFSTPKHKEYVLFSEKLQRHRRSRGEYKFEQYFPLTNQGKVVLQFILRPTDTSEQDVTLWISILSGLVQFCQF
jgi:hypothetical protein